MISDQFQNKPFHEPNCPLTQRSGRVPTSGRVDFEFESVMEAKEGRGEIIAIGKRRKRGDYSHRQKKEQERLDLYLGKRRKRRDYVWH